MGFQVSVGLAREVAAIVEGSGATLGQVEGEVALLLHVHFYVRGEF